MAKKKISDLDAYGSADLEKALKDEFEVSKNEGTYGTPSYPVGSSRRISLEQLRNNIQLRLVNKNTFHTNSATLVADSYNVFTCSNTASSYTFSVPIDAIYDNKPILFQVNVPVGHENDTLDISITGVRKGSSTINDYEEITITNINQTLFLYCFNSDWRLISLSNQLQDLSLYATNSYVNGALEEKLDRSGSNANQDIDIGGFGVNAKHFKVKGTAGSGHVSFKHQSADIFSSASESSLAADSSGNPIWKNDSSATVGIELQSNKTDTVIGNETNSTKYASIKGFFDYLVGMTWLTSTIWGTWQTALSPKTTIVDADTALISDSADSNKSKKVSWSNIWTNYLKPLVLSGGTLTGALNEAAIVDVASASTISLAGINANTINITGTTTIATITGVLGGGIRRFIFNGTLTIGHNTSFILCPNNTNLVVNSGDVVDFVLTTTGALKIINYAPFVPIILKNGATGGYYSNYPLNLGGFNSDAFITLFGQANNDATKPVQIGRKSATTSGKTVMKFAGTNGGGANGVWMSLFDSAYSANPRYFNVWNCEGGGVIIGATTGSNNVNDVNQTLQVFKTGVKIVDNSGVENSVTAPSDSVFNTISTIKGSRPFPEFTYTAMNALTGVANGLKVAVVEATNKDGIYIYNSTYSMFLSANYVMIQYISTFPRAIGFWAQTPVANTIYGETIRIEQDIIVTSMGCYTVASNGSETFYLDIYDMAGNRLTGGTLTPSTQNDEVFCTVAFVKLTAQTEYKLTLRSNGTNASFAQKSGFSTSSTRLSWTATGVTGASPSTLPTVSNSTIQPFISLKTA